MYIIHQGRCRLSDSLCLIIIYVVYLIVIITARRIRKWYNVNILKLDWKPKENFVEMAQRDVQFEPVAATQDLETSDFRTDSIEENDEIEELGQEIGKPTSPIKNILMSRSSESEYRKLL
eukprot:UN31539